MAVRGLADDGETKLLEVRLQLLLQPLLQSGLLRSGLSGRGKVVAGKHQGRDGGWWTFVFLNLPNIYAPRPLALRPSDDRRGLRSDL